MDNHRRGLHIAVINPSSFEVEFAKVFDTYKSSDDFEDFMNFDVKPGQIIVAACQDECVTELSPDAK